MSYPPLDHLLSDLGMEAEITGESTASVRTRVTDHTTAGDGGARAGVLATLVDIVGGAIAARVLRPDWMATADLTLKIVAPATGPWVEARGSVLRRGRTTLVVEALVYNVNDDGMVEAGEDGSAAPVAWATMTFAILPAGNSASPVTFDAHRELPVRWSFEGKGLGSSVVDAAGIRVVDAKEGRITMDVREYLLNSFGAVQGGVMALLGDVAGSEALGCAGPVGTGALVTDLEVSYLALGRIGPMTTRASVLDPGASGHRGGAVVEVVDEGADGRVTSVINVGATYAATGSEAARDD